MRIADSDINAWMQPLVGKQGATWPQQRTFHEILHGGEMHRYQPDAHLIVARAVPRGDAHLLTTSRLLAGELTTEEHAFLRNTLTRWTPPNVWVAWLQRDTRMTRGHEALIDASGLRSVTARKIRGWAISVNVKMADLEALVRGQ
jgi:hypothetical protein